MELKDNVKELQQKGMTFVKLAVVMSFLDVCDSLGIDVCGGAFDNAMTGQWFYI